MSSYEEEPLSHPEVRDLDVRLSVASFVATAALLTFSFMVVVRDAWSIPSLSIAIALMAGLAAAAQLIGALQLTLAPSRRWFTACFLLCIPLYMLTVGLTAWMFATLYTRTMMPHLMP